MNAVRPGLPEHFEYRLGLANCVTPRLLKDKPVHRWFYFAHSFSPQLVDLLLDEWGVEPGALVVDPFVGAGTTLCAAHSRGVDAVGFDLSPLAVFVSTVKVRDYMLAEVRDAIDRVRASARGSDQPPHERPLRLKRAFTDAEFATLERLRRAIRNEEQPARDLLLLALLRAQQGVSRAVPDGGWFRWRGLPSSEAAIWPTFQGVVDDMLADIEMGSSHSSFARALRCDARDCSAAVNQCARLNGGCEAVITSPPYPNRHDYTRVHHIELLSLGLSEQEIFDLRHGSLRSHVEARPPNGSASSFMPPRLLADVLQALPDTVERRVPSMLAGYFEDMHAVLAGCRELLVPGGRMALVVGNVRHGGQMIPVDDILLRMAHDLGFRPLTSWVARLRGNSAQQMGRFGRVPARESVVLLQKP